MVQKHGVNGSGDWLGINYNTNSGILQSNLPSTHNCIAYNGNSLTGLHASGSLC